MHTRRVRRAGVTNSEPNRVAWFVRTMREARGWTQAQLAERTGGILDRAYVSKIESGRNQASSAAVRQALASAFSISLEDLSSALEGKPVELDPPPTALAKPAVRRTPTRLAFARTLGVRAHFEGLLVDEASESDALAFARALRSAAELAAMWSDPAEVLSEAGFAEDAVERAMANALVDSNAAVPTNADRVFLSLLKRAGASTTVSAVEFGRGMEHLKRPPGTTWLAVEPEMPPKLSADTRSPAERLTAYRRCSAGRAAKVATELAPLVRSAGPGFGFHPQALERLTLWLFAEITAASEAHRQFAEVVASITESDHGVSISPQIDVLVSQIAALGDAESRAPR